MGSDVCQDYSLLLHRGAENRRSTISNNADYLISYSALTIKLVRLLLVQPSELIYYRVGKLI